MNQNRPFESAIKALHSDKYRFRIVHFCPNIVPQHHTLSPSPFPRSSTTASSLGRNRTLLSPPAPFPRCSTLKNESSGHCSGFHKPHPPPPTPLLLAKRQSTKTLITSKAIYHKH
ncbi:hypothetical protein KSP39_PZI001293 [Platanthera zijinensis]|uniref:Uncharacterized protein n=1 Tax=Platanthera zijinensis TaxID=2320716 RepID=A0AAP0C2Y6_9ASPA